jgi:hypothetical protein
VTVYVDSANIEATVGRIDGIWCHLTADTPTELHAFAQRIGLQRRWYQGRCKSAMRGACAVLDGSCVHFHYDVTEGRRAAAVAAGATEIDIRQLGEILRARRQHVRG